MDTVQRRKVIEDEVGSKTKGSMRMMLALDEERAARSFSSSFPNFVRIMKQFNISGSYTLVSLVYPCLHISCYVFLKNVFGINSHLPIGLSCRKSHTNFQQHISLTAKQRLCFGI